MPIDPGAAAVDAIIQKLIKRFNKIFTEAAKEENKKLKEYLKKYDQKNKEKKKQVKAGELSQEAYKKWLEGQANYKKYLSEMVNVLTADAVTADMKAASAVKGYLPEAYAVNANYGIYQVDSRSLMDISWTLYDRHTVERLIKDQPDLLPPVDPNIPKDERWNRKKITGAITQGILQGESIPKIANRLQEVTDMDRRAAIRNARTACTGAQNAGRVDSYKYAQSLGIELEQEWLATLDAITRDSHRWMDGERAAVGTEFSNGLRYPGDPFGLPAEVYNCRCTLVPALAELDQSKADRYSKLDENEDYEEWKYGKEDTEEKRTAQELKAAQKYFSQMPDAEYKGIWKDPVKLSDYSSKAASIQAKREYYEKALSKYDIPGSPQYLEHQQLLAELNQYEKLGKAYMAKQAEITSLQSKLYQLQGGPPPQFSADAYEQFRKAAAQQFADRYTADKYYRPLLDAQWGSLTDEQKYAVWEYTRNSNPMNKPLCGYTEQWDRYYFKGVGNVDWSREDAWRTIDGGLKKFGHSNGHVDYAGTIRDLTLGLEKTTLTDDVWLRRASEGNGLAGLLEGNLISYNEAMKYINSGDIDGLRNIVLNQSFQSHSFMSTGVAKDAGFSGNVSYKIYAPKGTKAVYAEPQSYWGETIDKGSKLYKPGQSKGGVGSEAEVIIQRGTYYRITDIQKNGWGEIEVTMEVVEQPDYFKTGFEQTFDNGATQFGYKGKH